MKLLENEILKLRAGLVLIIILKLIRKNQC